MIKDLIHILSISAQVCLLSCILLWLWRFRSLPTEVRRLGPFLIATLIINITAIILGRHMISNLFLLHIYTLLEVFLWAYFYNYLFKDLVKNKNVLPLLLGIVSILIVTNSLLLEPMSGFNSNAKSLVQLLFMSASIFYFFNAFGKIDLTKPLPRSLSIINFAVLFYYSGSLFIFMFSKLLNTNKVAQTQQHGLWAINGLIYIIFLMLIFTGIWIATFQKKKSS